MADGARGGKVGRAERRALRHAALHDDMAKAAQAGDTGLMNGAPHIPSGMDDTPGAGLQSQWVPDGGSPEVKGTDPDSVDNDFLDGQEASMNEPDDTPGGEWESDRERELVKRAQERAATAEIGDDGNLARGAMTSTASHPTMTMPGPQDTGRPSATTS